MTAPNRDVLLAAKVNWGGYSGPFLRIALPCGHVREWTRPEDVPDHDVECKCGELDYPHFFIRYTS